MDANQTRIEDYLTQKAPGGLFSMIAEEEKAIPHGHGRYCRRNSAESLRSTR